MTSGIIYGIRDVVVQILLNNGETHVEAIENVKDAIKCWIETAEELGNPIPSPEEYKLEDEFSGKLTLRIPKSLHKEITEQSEKEGCSINQLIMMYMSTGIGNEFGKKKQ
jgi:antitoxin HicB